MAAGLIVGIAADAHAAEPVDARERRAIALFDEGTELYEQSQWAQAEARFQAAWEIRRTFDIAANLGDCELYIGQTREAAEHIAYALANFPLSGKPALRERLKARFEEARRPLAIAQVSVNVSGASVRVDGRGVGSAPLAGEVFLEPGRHRIEAQLRGYRTAAQTLDVKVGDALDVILTLDEAEPPRGEPNVALVVGGAALAVAGLSLGVTSVVLSNRANREAAALNTTVRSQGGLNACNVGFESDCATMEDHYRASGSFRNVAITGFVIGGVAAIGTLTYALVPHAPPASIAPRLHATVSAGPQGAGLAIGGTF